MEARRDQVESRNHRGRGTKSSSELNRRQRQKNAVGNPIHGKRRGAVNPRTDGRRKEKECISTTIDATGKPATKRKAKGKVKGNAKKGKGGEGQQRGRRRGKREDEEPKKGEKRIRHIFGYRVWVPLDFELDQEYEGTVAAKPPPSIVENHQIGRRNGKGG